jgi:hypothetical protein
MVGFPRRDKYLIPCWSPLQTPCFRRLLRSCEGTPARMIVEGTCDARAGSALQAPTPLFPVFNPLPPNPSPKNPSRPPRPFSCLHFSTRQPTHTPLIWAVHSTYWYLYMSRFFLLGFLFLVCAPGGASWRFALLPALGASAAPRH